ncbi:MAG TPA: hypothetical protein VD978_19585 [Azospirillum sp.]|nr:hypothetical protein [Azospirillum sp.]
MAWISAPPDALRVAAASQGMKPWFNEIMTSWFFFMACCEKQFLPSCLGPEGLDPCLHGGIKGSEPAAGHFFAKWIQGIEGDLLRNGQRRQRFYRP